jgi:hypothetical protein
MTKRQMELAQLAMKYALMRLGGFGEAARALECSRQYVYSWKFVPENYCKPLEDLSGVPASDLRPDLALEGFFDDEE